MTWLINIGIISACVAIICHMGIIIIIIKEKFERNKHKHRV